MEVIRENFEQLFPQVCDAIANCSFMSIDTEFTGLKVSDVKDNYFDSMEERYQVIKEASKQYIIIQFGLVTFFYDKDKDTFTHKAWNFYTYPSQTKNFMPTVRFMCESSAIEFLSSFGFDFNKLFHHGIPYLSNSNKNKVIEQQEERETKYENERPSLSVPEAFKKFVEQTKTVIKRFVASNKKEHVLEDLSPFQRRLVFEQFKPLYPNLLFETDESDMFEGDASDVDDAGGSRKGVETPISTPPNSGRKSADESLPKSMADLSLPTTVKQKPFKKRLKITKVSEEELRNRKAQKKLKFEMDVESMVGFSKVIQEMGKSGKVICGHNMLLDVCRAVNQFVDDLPELLEDFKSLVQSALPNLIDTKLMVCQLPFKEFFKTSVLSDVMKRLEAEPFVLEDCKVHPGELSKGYSLSQDKFHEAGYDAYITGLSFISLCKYLGTLQNPQKSRVLPDSPVVMPYINKLYVMRMMDICYMNISGIDLTPSRSHVFFIQCPKNTTVDTIRNWFSPFGQIQYYWINDTSLFVALMDKDQAPLIMRNLEPLQGYVFMPFERYTASKNQNRDTLTTETSKNDHAATATLSKRPKTDSNNVKRKPASKTPLITPPVMFEQPAWD